MRGGRRGPGGFTWCPRLAGGRVIGCGTVRSGGPVALGLPRWAGSRREGVTRTWGQRGEGVRVTPGSGSPCHKGGQMLAQGTHRHTDKQTHGHSHSTGHTHSPSHQKQPLSLGTAHRTPIPVTTAPVSAPSSQPAFPTVPVCYRRDFEGESPRLGVGDSVGTQMAGGDPVPPWPGRRDPRGRGAVADTAHPPPSAGWKPSPAPAVNPITANWERHNKL